MVEFGRGGDKGLWSPMPLVVAIASRFEAPPVAAELLVTHVSRYFSDDSELHFLQCLQSRDRGAEPYTLSAIRLIRTRDAASQLVVRSIAVRGKRQMSQANAFAPLSCCAAISPIVNITRHRDLSQMIRPSLGISLRFSAYAQSRASEVARPPKP